MRLQVGAVLRLEIVWGTGVVLVAGGPQAGSRFRAVLYKYCHPTCIPILAKVAGCVTRAVEMRSRSGRRKAL